jgi:hypothetical protein
MPAPSLYDVLGVPPTATRDQIRRAYLRIARHAHPDTGGSDARMQAVNEAWAVLGDEIRRREYDGRLDEEELFPSAAFEYRDVLDDLDDLDDDRPLAPPLPRLSILAVIPVAIFAVAVGAFSLGVALSSRPALAVAAVAFVVASALMIALPFIQMTRARRS